MHQSRKPVSFLDFIFFFVFFFLLRLCCQVFVVGVPLVAACGRDVTGGGSVVVVLGVRGNIIIIGFERVVGGAWSLRCRLV